MILRTRFWWHYDCPTKRCFEKLRSQLLPIRSQNMVSFEYAKSRFEQAPPPKSYSGHAGRIHSVGWNADGSRVATGSIDRTARVWAWARSSSSKDSLGLRGHEGSVDQLRWDPTHPERLATASDDRTVRIWDAKSAFFIHHNAPAEY